MTTCDTWVTLCPTEVQVGVRVVVLQWPFFTPSPGCVMLEPVCWAGVGAGSPSDITVQRR